MKYLKDGFRTIYHHFVIFPINDLFRSKLDYFPESRYANAVICYGYYDPASGMKVAIMGAGLFADGGVRIGKANNEIEFNISMEKLVNYDYYSLEDDPVLKKEYAMKLNQLEKYNQPSEMAAIRNYDFLDESRHPFMIDLVYVVFEKKEYESEKLLCRILGQKEHTFVAVMLKDATYIPKIIDGKLIEFYMENREGKEVCVCDVDRLKYYRQEDLKDGKILKQAIHNSLQKSNPYSYMEVLEIVRESRFFVGGYYYLDEMDQRKFQVETVDSLPDYFPVYSDELEALKAVHEEIYEMDLFELIDLAKNAEDQFQAIIINPNGELFVMKEGIWEALKQMISLNQEYN